MKLLKNFLILVILLAAFSMTGYSFYKYFRGPCAEPLSYSIGGFDTRFGISKEAFEADAAKAASVWEESSGKDLFFYDPNSSFKINLVYDQRQISTIQKGRIESGLDAEEELLKNLDAKFEAAKSEYNSRLAAHNNRIESFEAEKRDYDAKVEYWNSKGGAPKSQYESLSQEAANLKRTALEINSETDSLNAEAKDLNSLLDERNREAVQYNKVAENYNKQYEGGLEFDQAVYTGNAIKVYQFTNEKDLTLALAHELGHALGMNHIDNPLSIMYYLDSENSKSALAPSAEDLAELRRACKIQ